MTVTVCVHLLFTSDESHREKVKGGQLTGSDANAARMELDQLKRRVAELEAKLGTREQKGLNFTVSTYMYMYMYLFIIHTRVCMYFLMILHNIP